MKFDTIIIGGGLSGLVAGIKLQENGQRCAIISAGQSALHFSSGSFDLLGKLQDGTDVDNPIDSIGNLNSNHPYSYIGRDAISEYADDFIKMMKRAGVNLVGSVTQNHFHFTPMGGFKKTWLSLDDYTIFNNPDNLLWQSVAIINFSGFLDFYTKFIAEELEKRNLKCKLFSIDLPFIEQIRTNPTEMRSANIAKTFEYESNIDEFVKRIEPLIKDVEAVILPAVFGLSSDKPLKYLKSKITKNVCTIATMPPSVPGIRVQQCLVKYFIRQGGTFMIGDTVDRAEVECNQVQGIYTTNHSDIKLVANNYILASGSFFSRGIIAQPNLVYEPVFDLDVYYDQNRSNWYDKDIFARQKYMSFGVIPTRDFHAMRQEKPVSNLYVIGSVLSGYNALYEECGGGVAIMSAMHVADFLLTNK